MALTSEPRSRASSTGKSAEQTPPKHIAGGPSGFPLRFNVYAEAFNKTFLLGEHKNQAFYAISIHSWSWFSKSPPIVLHSGPNSTYPTLASVGYRGFRRRAIITLPPAPQGSPEDALTLELGSQADLQFVFSMGVGPKCEKLEEFGWRASSGEAITILHGKKRGHELVRLSRDVSPNAPPGVIRGHDGKEIVAAWTKAHTSMTKKATFAFLGSGLTGELGERWAIVAALSGLTLFQHEREIRQQQRSGSSSVAAVSAACATTALSEGVS